MRCVSYSPVQASTNLCRLKFGLASRSAGASAFAVASRCARSDMFSRMACAMAIKCFLDMIFSSKVKGGLPNTGAASTQNITSPAGSATTGGIPAQAIRPTPPLQLLLLRQGRFFTLLTLCSLKRKLPGVLLALELYFCAGHRTPRYGVHGCVGHLNEGLSILGAVGIRFFVQFHLYPRS